MNVSSNGRELLDDLLLWHQTVRLDHFVFMVYFKKEEKDRDRERDDDDYGDFEPDSPSHRAKKKKRRKNLSSSHPLKERNEIPLTQNLGHDSRSLNSCAAELLSQSEKRESQTVK